jgi:vacuolar-type H+-ATPase subunit H
MQKIPWRKSAKITKHMMMEDDSAKLTGKIEAVIAETEQTGEFSSDIATEAKPKTTWIWDRSRQAWVEIIETHTTDEPPEADDIIDAQPIEPPSLDTTDSSAHDFERPVRPRKIISPTASPTNVIDRLTPGEKSYSRYEHTADTGRLQDVVKTDASASVGAELEESRQLILREAETQAEKIIAWAEERARAWADRIITQAQEKAEESVEGIIARAEEKAAIHAENVIARAGESRGAGGKYYCQSGGKSEDQS